MSTHFAIVDSALLKKLASSVRFFSILGSTVVLRGTDVKATDKNGSIVSIEDVTASYISSGDVFMIVQRLVDAQMDGEQFQDISTLRSYQVSDFEVELNGHLLAVMDFISGETHSPIPSGRKSDVASRWNNDIPHHIGSDANIRFYIIADEDLVVVQGELLSVVAASTNVHNATTPEVLDHTDIFYSDGTADSLILRLQTAGFLSDNDLRPITNSNFLDRVFQVGERAILVRGRLIASMRARAAPTQAAPTTVHNGHDTTSSDLSAVGSSVTPTQSLLARPSVKPTMAVAPRHEQWTPYAISKPNGNEDRVRMSIAQSDNKTAGSDHQLGSFQRLSQGKQQQQQQQVEFTSNSNSNIADKNNLDIHATNQHIGTPNLAPPLQQLAAHARLSIPNGTTEYNGQEDQHQLDPISSHNSSNTPILPHMPPTVLSSISNNHVHDYAHEDHQNLSYQLPPPPPSVQMDTTSISPTPPNAPRQHNGLTQQMDSLEQHKARLSTELQQTVKDVHLQTESTPQIMSNNIESTSEVRSNNFSNHKYDVHSTQSLLPQSKMTPLLKSKTAIQLQQQQQTNPSNGSQRSSLTTSVKLHASSAVALNSSQFVSQPVVNNQQNVVLPIQNQLTEDYHRFDTNSNNSKSHLNSQYSQYSMQQQQQQQLHPYNKISSTLQDASNQPFPSPTQHNPSINLNLTNDHTPIPRQNSLSLQFPTPANTQHKEQNVNPTASPARFDNSSIYMKQTTAIVNGAVANVNSVSAVPGETPSLTLARSAIESNILPVLMVDLLSKNPTSTNLEIQFEREPISPVKNPAYANTINGDNTTTTPVRQQGQELIAMGMVSVLPHTNEVHIYPNNGEEVPFMPYKPQLTTTPENRKFVYLSPIATAHDNVLENKREIDLSSIYSSPVTTAVRNVPTEGQYHNVNGTLNTDLDTTHAVPSAGFSVFVPKAISFADEFAGLTTELIPKSRNVSPIVSRQGNLHSSGGNGVENRNQTAKAPSLDYDLRTLNNEVQKNVRIGVSAERNNANAALETHFASLEVQNSFPVVKEDIPFHLEKEHTKNIKNTGNLSVYSLQQNECSDVDFNSPSAPTPITTGSQVRNNNFIPSSTLPPIQQMNSEQEEDEYERHLYVPPAQASYFCCGGTPSQAGTPPPSVVNVSQRQHAVPKCEREQREVHSDVAASHQLASGNVLVGQDGNMKTADTQPNKSSRNWCCGNEEPQHHQHVELSSNDEENNKGLQKNPSQLNYGKKNIETQLIHNDCSVPITVYENIHNDNLGNFDDHRKIMHMSSHNENSQYFDVIQEAHNRAANRYFQAQEFPSNANTKAITVHHHHQPHWNSSNNVYQLVKGSGDSHYAQLVGCQHASPHLISHSLNNNYFPLSNQNLMNGSTATAAQSNLNNLMTPQHDQSLRPITSNSTPPLLSSYLPGRIARVSSSLSNQYHYSTITPPPMHSVIPPTDSGNILLIDGNSRRSSVLQFLNQEKTQDNNISNIPNMNSGENEQNIMIQHLPTIDQSLDAKHAITFKSHTDNSINQAVLQQQQQQQQQQHMNQLPNLQKAFISIAGHSNNPNAFLIENTDQQITTPTISFVDNTFRNAEGDNNINQQIKSVQNDDDRVNKVYLGQESPSSASDILHNALLKNNVDANQVSLGKKKIAKKTISSPTPKKKMSPPTSKSKINPASPSKIISPKKKESAMANSVKATVLPTSPKSSKKTSSPSPKKKSTSATGKKKVDIRTDDDVNKIIAAATRSKVLSNSKDAPPLHSDYFPNSFVTSNKIAFVPTVIPKAATDSIQNFVIQPPALPPSLSQNQNIPFNYQHIPSESPPTTTSAPQSNQPPAAAWALESQSVLHSLPTPTLDDVFNHLPPVRTRTASPPRALAQHAVPSASLPTPQSYPSYLLQQQYSTPLIRPESSQTTTTNYYPHMALKSQQQQLDLLPQMRSPQPVVDASNFAYALAPSALSNDDQFLTIIRSPRPLPVGAPIAAIEEKDAQAIFLQQQQQQQMFMRMLYEQQRQQQQQPQFNAARGFSSSGATPEAFDSMLRRGSYGSFQSPPRTPLLSSVSPISKKGKASKSVTKKKGAAKAKSSPEKRMNTIKGFVANPTPKSGMKVAAAPKKIKK